MRIIGYHIQDETIATSDGELCRQAPYLDFLLQEKGECIRVFYHLDYSVACLMRNIGLEDWEVKKLLVNSELWKNNYKLQYIPHKWFSIKKNGLYSGFSDMSQYLDWRFAENDDCKERSIEAQQTGQKVYDTLLKAKVYAKSLTSPVGAFEKSVMVSLDLPTCTDIPDEANQFAYACCHGSWLEIFKKGHFDCYDYDISGAYPYFTSNLLELRFGAWKQSKNYVVEAEYGYCKGIVTIRKTPSPIIYSVARDINYNPTGEWECYLTKGEIDFITKYGIGSFEILDGWWWTPNQLVYPLKRIIDNLYHVREQLNGLEREVIKRILTGLWGKFGEVWKDGTLGNYFNPVWMAEVESKTRLEVGRFIYGNNLINSLLSVAVDGVVSSQPVYGMMDKGLGSWRLSSHCPGFIISSGVVALKDKEATKDFSLRYDWLENQIKENPNNSEYTMTKLSPVTIGKAVNQNRYNELGKLGVITKYVDVSYEMKRDYPEIPNSGQDLLTNKYESYAIDVSRLKVQEIENDITLNRDSDRVPSMSVLER